MQETQQSGLDAESSAEEVKPKKFPVVEIFGPVIQGEGSQAGQQTMFVRFGGCDYKCAMCDSLHAVIPQAIHKHATWMTSEEISDKLEEAMLNTGVSWVTFSGGNPCMHKLDDLVEHLNVIGYSINVETQATLWQDWLYNCTVITVSPKSPGMGEKFEDVKYTNFLRKLNGVRPLCVKVVVFSEQDLEMALFIKSMTLDIATEWLYGGRENIAFYLSLGNPFPPVLDEEFNLKNHPDLIGFDGRREYEKDQAKDLLGSYRRLSEEVLQDRRMKDFKFLPQLHVLVYGNETGR